jgi:hypothetical protein
MSAVRGTTSFGGEAGPPFDTRAGLLQCDFSFLSLGIGSRNPLPRVAQASGVIAAGLNGFCFEGAQPVHGRAHVFLASRQSHLAILDRRGRLPHRPFALEDLAQPPLFLHGGDFEQWFEAELEAGHGVISKPVRSAGSISRTPRA